VDRDAKPVIDNFLGGWGNHSSKGPCDAKGTFGEIFLGVVTF